MNKQTLFVTLTAAALMCGCQSSKVKISGRFIGSDAKNVYLENASPLKHAGLFIGRNYLILLVLLTVSLSVALILLAINYYRVVAE